MCGIAGALAKKCVPSEKCLFEKAEAMLSRVEHRGYKANTKILTTDFFSIGCVRLPIVDEERGEQPITSSNGHITLVMNGEIYNFQALRAIHLSELQFHTDSDTEVVVNLIEKYGIEVSLPLLEGMFAIIGFESTTDHYFMARDLTGIKPLYFSESEDYLLAASEIKAFPRDSGPILELPPQHYFHSNKGIIRWEPAFSETKETLRQLISQSVKEQVNTHLPIAVFLSGGIDSSVICYEANQHHRDVTAFAIGKADSKDMQTATRFCKDFSFKFEPIYLKGDEPLCVIEDTIRCIESFEPNHIRAGCLSYLISQYVSSKGYRIALCGEGADELFAGYPDFIELLRGTGDDYSRLSGILDSYVASLFLTQLKRVDRTGMRFALEVRPPFLHSKIVHFAARLPAHKKITVEKNHYITKKPLRDAYRDILPAYIVDRVKSVFSEGAGFDTNGQHGPFWEYTKKKISPDEVMALQEKYPEYHLTTHEAAYYFKEYISFFDVKQVNPQRLTMSAL